MYLKRTLSFKKNDGSTHTLNQDELLSNGLPAIVLGEPGSGKTELLRSLAEPGSCVSFVTARAFIRNPQRHAKADVLLLDALDEVTAVKEGDALFNLLQALAEVDARKFLISCRAADWRHATAKYEIEEDFGVLPVVYDLQPIYDQQVQDYLRSAFGDSQLAESVHDSLKSSSLLAASGNPMFLRMTVDFAKSGNSFSNLSKSMLYRRVCEQLVAEANPVHAGDAHNTIAKEDLFEAAGGICAIMLLTGKSEISPIRSTEYDTALHLRECKELLSVENCEAALKTNLFNTIDGRFVPRHRTIAEFLGASWLAHTIEGERVDARVSKFLSLIQVDGHVPVSLRGIHAWLSLSDLFRRRVVNSDPYGVLRYADVSVFTADDVLFLVNSLEAFHARNPYFRADDFQNEQVVSVAQSPTLIERLRQILGATGEKFHLTSIVLELAQHPSLTEALSEELGHLLMNEGAYYAERQDAFTALFRNRYGSVNWVSVLEKLAAGNQDSNRLSVSILTQLGLDEFPADLVANCILGECGFPKEDEQDRETVLGSYFRLTQNADAQKLSDVLDALVVSIKARNFHTQEHGSLWAAYHHLAQFSLEAIPQVLASDVGTKAQSIWKWINFLVPSDLNSDNRKQKLDEFFETQPDLRTQVLDEALKASASSASWSFYEISAKCPGLLPTEQTVADLFGKLRERYSANEQDKSAAIAIFREAGRFPDLEKRLQIEFLALSDGDADFRAYFQKLSFERRAEWKQQEKEFEEKHSEYRVGRERKLRELRQGFVDNLEELRNGELKWTYVAARGYLGLFSDVKFELPPVEKLTEWLGSDVAEAALVGFVATLSRPDLPTPTQIGESYGEGRRWNLIFPIIAGVAEYYSKNQSFEKLSDETLLSGWLGMRGEHLEGSDPFVELSERLFQEISRRGDLLELALRQWFEPQFGSAKDHVSGLYKFVRETEPEGLVCRLSLEWLDRFETLSSESLIELLRACLLVDDFNHTKLAGLADVRLSSEIQDEEHKLIWMALSFIVDFERFSKNHETPPKKSFLWNIATLYSLDGGRGNHRLELSSDQLAWIIANFRSLWPKTDRPNATSWGDSNPWDASQLLLRFSRTLSERSDQQSVQLLTDLSKAEDNYQTDMIAFLADQKRRLVETSFESPSVKDLVFALRDHAPQNATALRLEIIACIEDLEKKLKGNSTDSIRLFYTDDLKPKTENQCRDVFVDLLHLTHGITAFPEEQMPGGTRADVGFHFRNWRIPLEAKGQWHQKLWTAPVEQLKNLYSIDHLADKEGIFLVFWFGLSVPAGRRLKLPPEGSSRPESALDLQKLLLEKLPEVLRDNISIKVLDLDWRKT